MAISLCGVNLSESSPRNLSATNWPGSWIKCKTPVIEWSPSGRSPTALLIPHTWTYEVFMKILQEKKIAMHQPRHWLNHDNDNHFLATMPPYVQRSNQQYWPCDHQSILAPSGSSLVSYPPSSRPNSWGTHCKKCYNLKLCVFKAGRLTPYMILHAQHQKPYTPIHRSCPESKTKQTGRYHVSNNWSAIVPPHSR